MTLFSRNNNRTRRFHTPRKLAMEPLERRELLSINLLGTELQILGTSGADHAAVDYHPSTDRYHPIGHYHVELNGSAAEFSSLSVGRILFRGYGGDDEFRNNTSAPSEAYGGAGRDTLCGGAGNDVLIGGTNVDYLYGYYGDDTLYGDDRPATGLIKTSSGATAVVDFTGGASASATVETGAKDYLYGGYCNDSLFGGVGDDELWGEAGDDQLYGEKGNDRLMGEADSDILHGGAGDDGLFGGCDAVRDELWGDEADGVRGQDRFLTRDADAAADLSSLDAEIRVDDGSDAWEESEVYYVDKGLARLQGLAHTALILKDTLGDGPIEFVKETELINDHHEHVRGWNEVWEDTSGGAHNRIRMADLDQWGRQYDSDRFEELAVHEMAHNWDASPPAQTTAHPGGYDYWDRFAALHEDSDFDHDGDFADVYGKTNANEDWATCWESVIFRPTLGTESGPSCSDVLQQKLDIVREFFARFDSWDLVIVVAASMASSGD